MPGRCQRRRLIPVRLLCAQQAEVTGRKVQRAVLQHEAQAGQARLRECLRAEFGVPDAAHTVEDDARDIHPFAKVAQARRHGRYSAGHAARVDHQHDSRAQQPGKRGGGMLVAAWVASVVEAHNAFDHADFGLGRRPCKKGLQPLRRQQKAVQVARFPPGSSGEMGGIEVIGAEFKGLHAQATRTQGETQQRGDGGFAAARARSGEDETVNIQSPSVPRSPARRRA